MKAGRDGANCSRERRFPYFITFVSRAYAKRFPAPVSLACTRSLQRAPLQAPQSAANLWINARHYRNL